MPQSPKRIKSKHNRVQKQKQKQIEMPNFQDKDIEIIEGNWFIVATENYIELFENQGKPDRKIYTIPIRNNWKNLIIEKQPDGFEAFIIRTNDGFYFRVAKIGKTAIFELSYADIFQLFHIKIPAAVADIVISILLKRKEY
jgi:hypothetical protein